MLGNRGSLETQPKQSSSELGRGPQHHDGGSTTLLPVAPLTARKALPKGPTDKRLLKAKAGSLRQQTDERLREGQERETDGLNRDERDEILTWLVATRVYQSPLKGCAIEIERETRSREEKQERKKTAPATDFKREKERSDI